MKKGTINNGSRVQVEHACYSGTAGRVETEGATFLSFPVPKSTKQHPKPGDMLKVDGVEVGIVAARLSHTMREMIVLTIADKEPENGVSD